MLGIEIVTNTPSRLRRTPPASLREKECFLPWREATGEYPEGGRGCVRTLAWTGMERDNA
jgi:hypothetical protein